MDRIKRMFGGKPPDAHTHFNPIEPTEGGSDFHAQIDTRCELVRVRMRNTLRLSGIPENWIEAQLLLESQGGRTFVHLHLVVRRWDERLQRYGVALQRKLLDEIERIDPQAREWLRSISWHYPTELDCPFPELPQPSVWIDQTMTVPPRPVEAEADNSESDGVEADIALLFELRDAELARPDATKGNPAA
jgi:hypothetical protein